MRKRLNLFNGGSFSRQRDPHLFVEANDEAEEGGVATKDVVLDHNLGLWVRIYLPSILPNSRCRLPLIVYFHGGGFCLGSPAFPDFHNFSVKLAATAGAVIVSVAYRLAPEHRLPAAYDDCLSALHWVWSHACEENREGFEADAWLRSHADLEKLYLLGDSAGANIVHQVLLRTSEAEAKEREWINGAILLQPFFGGQERKQSEMECAKDAFLSLDLSDACWRLSLPEGSEGERDDPFCNPWGPRSPDLTRVSFPRLLVVVGGKDVLRDRGLEYGEGLKRMGKQVEVMVLEEEEHAFYALNLHSLPTQTLLHHFSSFVHPRCRSRL